MERLLLAALLLLSAACSRPGAERPRLAQDGLPAPELRLPKLLNAPLPGLKGWEDLRGKVVVLEFWATWSEPFSESLPRVNQLAARFAGKPVVFLFITDENEAAVKTFLSGRRLDGWVAPAAGQEPFKAFRVYDLPKAVLVDREGRVAASYQTEASEGDIASLLAGRPLRPNAPGGDPAAVRISSGDALAKFSMAEAAAGGGFASYGPGFMYASGMPLRYALEAVCGKADRLEVKPGAAAAMAKVYDIRLRVPRSGAAAKKEFFLKGLEAALGLKVKETSADALVYALRTVPGGPRNVRAAGAYGGSAAEGSVLKADGATFEALAAALGERLRVPVYDETGVAGPVAYAFDLGQPDLKGMDAQLRARLGLRLEKVKRKLRMLEVSPV
jgi:thiol-disulfide isomerase/thioredoxin